MRVPFWIKKVILLQCLHMQRTSFSVSGCNIFFVVGTKQSEVIQGTNGTIAC